MAALTNPTWEAFGAIVVELEAEEMMDMALGWVLFDEIPPTLTALAASMLIFGSGVGISSVDSVTSSPSSSTGIGGNSWESECSRWSGDTSDSWFISGEGSGWFTTDEADDSMAPS
ncbi:hypothetical protein WICPIJ_005884 [Wickerhamomyces pijperi]|uniref:Uncharacterized protein n=1 Tax=Wickerhamomyces pijperi TaxID=599730 RepID=A0A9P8Q322_WICPI|nr:hypothetical protein WICPIJ_005884 [Wickerhamomyces pijperi]